MGREPEIRWDPLWRRSVVIAADRGKRPEDFHRGDDATEPHAPPDCPFCAGNEHLTPDATLQWPPPPAPWQVRIVPNKYGAFSPSVSPGELSSADADGSARSSGESRPAYGVHEVIVESPSHSVHPADFSATDWVNAWGAVSRRVDELRRDGRLSFAFLFKNQGREAGASRAHPHSQLVAGTRYPAGLQEMLPRLTIRKDCALCAHLGVADGKDLVVAENGDFVAFAPWSSGATFEVWIAPRGHGGAFFGLKEASAASLGELMRTTLQRLRQVAGQVAFNILYHSGPFDAADVGYHWRIEIVPRVGLMAGFELGTGDRINSVPPEEAASVLRSASCD